MGTFDSARRELLRLGSVGMATLAVPGVALQANAGKSAGVSQVAFDVRRYGATGDGKTVDSPAINRAIDEAAAAGGGLVVFSCGHLCLFLDSPQEPGAS